MTDLPDDLLRRAAEWADLHRWERRQLGVELRRRGLTYREIMSVIPVPKSTLSNWCAGVHLTESQIAAIHSRCGSESRRGIPVDTQWRRRRDIERLRRRARHEALARLDDSAWVAGVVLYWGEGSKSRNYLDLTDSDPAALRLFIRWVRRYVDPDARFVLALHLHEGNDERAAFAFWRGALGLPKASFTKTYIKPRGTGHRKNHLPHSVCRVRTRNAADPWNKVMVWISVVAEHFGSLGDPNRYDLLGSLAQFGRASDS